MGISKITRMRREGGGVKESTYTGTLHCRTPGNKEEKKRKKKLEGRSTGRNSRGRGTFSFPFNRNILLCAEEVKVWKDGTGRLRANLSRLEQWASDTVTVVQELRSDRGDSSAIQADDLSGFTGTNTKMHTVGGRDGCAKGEV